MSANAHARIGIPINPAEISKDKRTIFTTAQRDMRGPANIYDAIPYWNFVKVQSGKWGHSQI